MNIAKLFKGIKGKLLIVMMIPLFATSLTMFLVYRQFNHLGQMMDEVYDTTLPNTGRVGTMNTARALLGYYFYGAMASKPDSKERAEFISKAESFFEVYKKNQAEYEAIPFDAEEGEIYKAILNEKEAFNAATAEVIVDIKTGQDEKAMALVNNGNWHKQALNVRATLDKLVIFFDKQARDNDAIQTAERKESMIILLALGIGSLALIVLTVGWISVNLSKSISEVSDVLSSSITQVAAAIQQLSAAGTTLSSSTSNSAAALQETVASVEELSSTVKYNSGNAKQAAELSGASKDSAQSGEREIRNLIESMKDISSSSRKIEEIINVIDDIAFQTNLLALNAAVEAARAGDQGRGFAVVAEAVRALAQRSSVAAKDISNLIKESVHKIENGVTTADKSGEVLGAIVLSVNQVSDLNKEISTASQEQTNGISQISMAMNQLDQSVQTNASSAEEIASTSTEIASQAEKMQHVMEMLNLVVFGDAAGPAQGNNVREMKKAKRKASVVASIPISEAEKMIPLGEPSAGKRVLGKVENF